MNLPARDGPVWSCRVYPSGPIDSRPTTWR